MKRHGRAAALFALLLGLAVPAGDARADGAPRIVIIAPTSQDRVSVRLQAELRTLHFDVPDIEVVPDPPSRPQLEEAARKREAVAAVRIVPSSAGVEVWIVDRMTGKTVLREIVTPEGDSASGATVALRVVELLRASLMELDAQRPPPGEMPPPPMIRDLMAPRPRDPASQTATLPEPPPPAFSMELGPGTLLSPGGFGPSGIVSAAVHFKPTAPNGASLFALIPVVPATVSGPEGTTTARATLLGAGVRITLAPRASAWSVALGVGISALWLHLDGQPSRGFVGASGDVFSAAPYLRAGLGLAVVPRLRLRADALCGVAMPAAVVKFGERPAAAWGVPFVAPTLGLELLWQ